MVTLITGIIVAIIFYFIGRVDPERNNKALFLEIGILESKNKMLKEKIEELEKDYKRETSEFAS